MKALLELDEQRGGILDRDFIAMHTEGYEALAADLAETQWPQIEKESGLTRAQLEQVAGPMPSPMPRSSPTAWASRSTTPAPGTCG